MIEVNNQSLTSNVEDLDFAIGGSSMAKGRVEMAALSRKNAFDPFTYYNAEDWDPTLEIGVY